MRRAQESTSNSEEEPELPDQEGVEPCSIEDWKYVSGDVGTRYSLLGLPLDGTDEEALDSLKWALILGVGYCYSQRSPTKTADSSVPEDLSPEQLKNLVLRGIGDPALQHMPLVSWILNCSPNAANVASKGLVPQSG